MNAPADLIELLRAAGGALLLGNGEKIRFSGPDTEEVRGLIGQLRPHRQEVERILRLQSAWPVPLCYAEYFCRMRDASFAPALARNGRSSMARTQNVWPDISGFVVGAPTGSHFSDVREGSMKNIETLMAELARASVNLKRALYRRDEGGSTSPEGTDGVRIEVHACRLCNRAAAGKGAEVRHRTECALARLQRAQKALREAWPELFEGEFNPKMPTVGARAHLR